MERKEKLEELCTKLRDEQSVEYPVFAAVDNYLNACFEVCTALEEALEKKDLFAISYGLQYIMPFNELLTNSLAETKEEFHKMEEENG